MEHEHSERLLDEEEEMLSTNGVEYNEIKFDDNMLIIEKFKKCIPSYEYKENEKVNADIIIVEDADKCNKEKIDSIYKIMKTNNDFINGSFSMAICCNNQYTILDGKHRILAYQKFLKDLSPEECAEKKIITVDFIVCTSKAGEPTKEERILLLNILNVYKGHNKYLITWWDAINGIRELVKEGVFNLKNKDNVERFNILLHYCEITFPHLKFIKDIDIMNTMLNFKDKDWEKLYDKYKDIGNWLKEDKKFWRQIGINYCKDEETVIEMVLNFTKETNRTGIFKDISYTIENRLRNKHAYNEKWSESEHSNRIIECSTYCSDAHKEIYNESVVNEETKEELRVWLNKSNTFNNAPPINEGVEGILKFLHGKWLQQNRNKSNPKVTHIATPKPKPKKQNIKIPVQTPKQQIRKSSRIRIKDVNIRQSFSTHPYTNEKGDEVEESIVNGVNENEQNEDILNKGSVHEQVESETSEYNVDFTENVDTSDSVSDVGESEDIKNECKCLFCEPDEETYKIINEFIAGKRFNDAARLIFAIFKYNHYSCPYIKNGKFLDRYLNENQRFKLYANVEIKKLEFSNKSDLSLDNPLQSTSNTTRDNRNMIQRQSIVLSQDEDNRLPDTNLANQSDFESLSSEDSLSRNN